MCGILGYIGNKNVSQVLIDGLRRLEYRGYDSAGVAVLSTKGLALRRAVGKLSALERLLKKHPVDGVIAPSAYTDDLDNRKKLFQVLWHDYFLSPSSESATHS